MDSSEVVAALKKAESHLGPASANVTVTPTPPDTGDVNPQRLWGTFDWQIVDGKTIWRQHFTEADIAPHRGARSVIAEMRDNRILWYEVFDTGTVPGIGRIGKPGTNAAPMIGRTYMGRWLSTVVERMHNVTVIEKGNHVVVQGGEATGNLVLTFDRSQGWIATKMSYTSPQDPGLVDEWTINKAVESDGSWYVVDGTSHFAFRTTRGITGKDISTTVIFSDLKTGAEAKPIAFPKPPEGVLVADTSNSSTYKLRPDGTLEFLEKRERPQRRVIGWNWLFVASGAILLLVSLSWLILSKRRSPVSL